MSITEIKMPGTPTSTKSKKSSKSEATLPGEPSDTFTKQTQQAQERHLKMEQLAQLQAQDQLHKARIQALFAQLQTQLFAIWNDIWMQRRKVHDDAFKAWMKLLVA